eukprot:203097_1
MNTFVAVPLCRYHLQIFCNQFVNPNAANTVVQSDKNHLTVPLGVLSESEVSPSAAAHMHSYHNKKVIEMSSSYDTGHPKQDFQYSWITSCKHYGDEFDLNVLREIIYRLTIKDKIKELKRVQNLYQSRDAV